MAEGSHALSALLPRSAIRVGVEAADWRAAVTAAGDVLVSSGATAPAYTGEMIAAIEQMGSYMVIAPGIALPHARPSPAVLRVGLSVVALAEASTVTPVILLSPLLQSLRTLSVKVPFALVSPGSVELAVPSTAPVVQVAPARYVSQALILVASVSKAYSSPASAT